MMNKKQSLDLLKKILLNEISYEFLTNYLLGMDSFSSLYLRVEKELKEIKPGTFSRIFNKIERASDEEASLFDLRYRSYLFSFSTSVEKLFILT